MDIGTDRWDQRERCGGVPKNGGSQQARQRADVYVGDVCHPTQKTGTVTPRVDTNTNTPTSTKAAAQVPMDVSQMSSNVPKTEEVEQESDSYQYEQDQECEGDELFAVKGKGKSVFWEPVFSGE